MNASSQNPPGALPPEMPFTGKPLPDAVRAAYATFGVAIPAPVGAPALQRSADQAPAMTTLQAAAAVMDAKIKENGAATGAELAEAEAMAGVFFDAAHVEAVRTAEREQARTEYKAELAETRRQLGLIAGSRRQVEAVLRLCEGRRGDDLLLVSAVAVAAECGTTALDDLPMILTWTGSAKVPDAHSTHKRVVVECTSSYGGRADLVIDGDERQALASLLDLQVRDIHATCATRGCGEAAEAELSDLFGWSRLEIASLGDGPRWYCSDMCVVDALARAGHELAAADRAAGGSDSAADLDARYGPGASDEYALQVAEATEAGFEDERGDVDEGGAQ